MPKMVAEFSAKLKVPVIQQYLWKNMPAFLLV